MRSFNEALHDTKNHTPLPRVPTTYVNTNSGDMAEAVRTNRSLRLLMESARAEHAPSWQTGQRVGVLDVMRYKTRQPGDMEFFRNIAEGGDLRLPNLAVSVLLDGSGSMSSYVTALGKAAYAIKSACDACEVPCTVTRVRHRGPPVVGCRGSSAEHPGCVLPAGWHQPDQRAGVHRHADA